MKSVFLGLSLVALLTTCNPATAAIVIDFDNAANWTAGSGGVGSYQSDHVYADQGMVFTGGPALRNGVTAQDGFAGALGTYSWRLQNNTSVSWTGTLADASTTPTFDTFSFAARRWDNNPSTDFDIAYSINGGVDFTSVGTINSTTLDDSSDWKTFSFNIGTTTVGNGDFVFRLAANGTTERLMIDNFSLTSVPEPNSFALLGVISAAGMVARRRKLAKPNVA